MIKKRVMYAYEQALLTWGHHPDIWFVYYILHIFYTANWFYVRRKSHLVSVSGMNIIKLYDVRLVCHNSNKFHASHKSCSMSFSVTTAFNVGS